MPTPSTPVSPSTPKLLAGWVSAAVSASAAGFVMTKADHLEPHAPLFIGGGLLLFFTAFFFSIAMFGPWRGSRLREPAPHVDPGSSAETRRLGLRAGVYGLCGGTKYRVIQTITDYYGDVFAVGDTLTYVQRDFLPYHGGHTVYFVERPMYLQEQTNADIVSHLDRYLEITQ